MATLRPRLSISRGGAIQEEALKKKHAGVLASLHAKLEVVEGVLTPEQEEVQLAYDLARDAASRVGFNCSYAVLDGTGGGPGGSSLVLSNGTGVYVYIFVKYLPDFRDDRKALALRKKQLLRVHKAAEEQARRFKAEVGKGVMVWAAVLSNVRGLEWVSQPSMPSDLDEVELLIPAHQGRPGAAAAVEGHHTGGEPCCLPAVPEEEASPGAAGPWAPLAWVAGAAAAAGIVVAWALRRH